MFAMDTHAHARMCAHTNFSVHVHVLIIFVHSAVPR